MWLDGDTLLVLESEDEIGFKETTQKSKVSVD